MTAPRYSRAFCEPQYNQRFNVPDQPALLAQRAALSARVRRELPGILDLAYGDRPGEKLDIYQAAGTQRPVMIFIHGGYWQRHDKAELAFLAEPFVQHGITLVCLNYDLCPDVTLDTIVDEVRKACVWTWRHIAGYGGDPGSLFVSGNSAGGHLTAMMVATDWTALDPTLPPDLLKGALAISGIYDLEPLLHTTINDAVQLDAAAARRNSPLFAEPPVAMPLIVAVGALESDEFKRQTQLLVDCWSDHLPARAVSVPDAHHFNILLGMAAPASPLFEEALALIAPAPAGEA